MSRAGRHRTEPAGQSFSEGSTHWRLKHAVLVYDAEHTIGDARSAVPAYATVHRVRVRHNQAQLEAGVPATREACADLARALGANAALAGFIPEHLLHIGSRSLMWWRPAAPALMHFDCRQAGKAGEVLGVRAGRCAQPALVFAVNHRSWWVFALAGNTRPEPGTKLLRAPYLNVWADGRICTGNAALPTALSPAALAGYEKAFFESRFTHSNLHGKKRLVRTGSVYALWRGLLDTEKKIPQIGFPVHQLVQTKTTLSDLAGIIEEEKP